MPNESPDATIEHLEALVFQATKCCEVVLAALGSLSDEDRTRLRFGVDASRPFDGVAPNPPRLTKRDCYRDRPDWHEQWYEGWRENR